MFHYIFFSIAPVFLHKFEHITFQFVLYRPTSYVPKNFHANNLHYLLQYFKHVTMLFVDRQYIFSVFLLMDIDTHHLVNLVLLMPSFYIFFILYQIDMVYI